MERCYKSFLILYICLFFILSIASNGEANVSNVSASPNPFNPQPPDNESSNISFYLNSSALLWLRIYDSTNVLTKTLETPPNSYTEDPVYGTQGNHSITWDGTDDSLNIVPEGFYSYHIDDISWKSSSSVTQLPLDVIVDPTNSNKLWMTYYATIGQYLYKSTDGGSTWQMTGLSYAYSLAISNDGQKIFVLDQHDKILYRSFDGLSSYTTVSLWSGASNPTDIACSADGTILYGVDSGTKKVYKSTNSGTSWNSGTSLSNSVTLSGVAVDPNNSNNVLVADVGASTGGSSYPTVYESANGGTSFSTALYQKGTADGQFKSGNGAYRISIDTNGYYWVSDRGNNRIQEFNSNNNWVMTVGGTSSGTGNYQFDSYYSTSGVYSLGLSAASIGANKYVYVADLNNRKIKRYEYDNYASSITVTSDKTSPSAINDLSATGNVGSNSVHLTWTAPGDVDNVPGAASYDVRYAKTPINTDSDFNSSTQATGEPTPSVQGTPEYFWMTGLESNTTYYFAIKSSDVWGNKSGLSNSPSGKTALLWGWNMVSCPLQPSPNDPNSVFGDDAWSENCPTCIYYWYSLWTGTGDPNLAGDWAGATTVNPGIGLFLYSFRTTEPTDATGTNITNASYSLYLSPGWNLIGNPYGTSVDLSNCHVIYNSTEKNYLDAVTSSWIGNAVYIWNGSTYIDYPWDSAKLEPWKGYWIMSYYDLDLIIYKP
jgi:hypothetical protein